MKDRTYLPIAIGFYLLGLPLFAAALLARSASGAWTNAVAGAVLLLLGVLVQWKGR